ncbi:MAG: hypothetical protein LUD17_03965 [Bacteroidales bacterium]|nr:hypothetical protein [Bacteroidales bacterium]
MLFRKTYLLLLMAALSIAASAQDLPDSLWVFSDTLPDEVSVEEMLMQSESPADSLLVNKNLTDSIVVIEAGVDTLPMAPEIPEFSRGLKQIVFIPKGQWITGVSVSYSQSNQKNYQFLIVESLDGDTYTFKVTPMLLYAFADNLAAGGKLAYTRQRTRLDYADVKVDSETDDEVDNLYSISHTYSAMAAFRNYISFGSSTRFGMFNEVQLQFSGGESKLCNGAGDDLTGTFERTFSLNVGVAPGMIMFLNNYSAIEVNVGVLGFNYSHTKSTTDQVYIANRHTKSANFRVNLFSITFGVVFYL